MSRMETTMYTVSRTQVWLTKIPKLCQEIRDIKQQNKDKYIQRQLSKSNPLNCIHKYKSAELGTCDEGGECSIYCEDSTPTRPVHLSYNLHSDPHGTESLAQTLSSLTPPPVRTSHTLSPP